jgi:hypothetical protein
MKNFTKCDAILSLVKGAWTMQTGGKVVYHDGQTPPSEETIQVEIDRLQAEYDAQEYARKREAEYPSIAELTVALYDTDDKSAVEAKRASVKAKYPKPS